MNLLTKVKVCTPYGAGWATEITSDDFVRVELEDQAVWIRVTEIQVDRRQFLGGFRLVAGGLIAGIVAGFLGYLLL